MRPDTAMILAAGLGTRMRPLTDTLPKPLVALGGKALIDHVLDRLSDAGITDAVVNVHHHAGLLEQHLKLRTRPKIIISDERDALLDTGGGAVRALWHFSGLPFLIHNSDSVWIEGSASALARLLDAWDADRMDSLMLLAPSDASLGYSGRGDFDMSEDGAISRPSGGGAAPFVFAGVSVAHPRLFEGAPQGRFSLNTLWNAAIARRRLFGLRLDGLWMHVGDPQALEDAERALAQHRAEHASCGVPR